MKTLAAALVLALIVSCFVPGPGAASPLKRFSLQQGEFYQGNPEAPELYAGIAQVYRLAQKEALAKLLPSRKQNVIVGPVRDAVDTVSKPENNI